MELPYVFYVASSALLEKPLWEKKNKKGPKVTNGKNSIAVNSTESL